MASQKETVENFLSGLKGDVTATQAWEMFHQFHDQITKANYSFYANQAKKAGIWTPAETLININLNDNSNFPAAIPFEISTTDPSTINKSDFVGLRSNTAFDTVSSSVDGPMRGTVTMITGESGCGKTTICTNLAEYIKRVNPSITTGFVSAEMDRGDWRFEIFNNPALGKLETIYMLEYLDAPNYLEVLIKALRSWDYVIVDSFEVIIDQLKELKGWSSKKAESELIKYLRQAAFECNSCIMVIQQWTKSGGYVGSTKIKHLTTAMIYVMFDDNGDRYIVYTKNRRCGHMVGKRVYFTKNKQTGMLEFDEKRFQNSLAITQHAESNAAQINDEDNDFDAILKKRAAQLEAAEKSNKHTIAVKEQMESVAA